MRDGNWQEWLGDLMYELTTPDLSTPTTAENNRERLKVLRAEEEAQPDKRHVGSGGKRWTEETRCE